MLVPELWCWCWCCGAGAGAVVLVLVLVLVLVPWGWSCGAGACAVVLVLAMGAGCIPHPAQGHRRTRAGHAAYVTCADSQTTGCVGSCDSQLVVLRFTRNAAWWRLHQPLRNPT